MEALSKNSLIVKLMESQKNSLYRALFNMSAEPMMVSIKSKPSLELHRTIVDVNDAFLKLTGHQRDEVIGNTVEGVLGVRHAQIDKFATALRKKGILTIATTIRTKDRKNIQIEIHVARFDYKNQNLHIAVLHNVSKHIEAEKKARKQYQKELDLKKALKQSMDSRAHFNRLLVHELKTYLTPMISASDALTNGLKDEPWLSLSEQISQSSRDINKRVDELFDLAKSEKDCLDINPDVNSVLNLFKGPLALAKVHASENGVKLYTHFEGLNENRYGFFDSARMKQVLTNLLNNAIRYTESGGSVTCTAKVLSHSELEVKIVDTGIGIPKKYLEHIFEPYNTSCSEIMDLPHGLGLGLALSKKFIELHGGKIWINSYKGRGTLVGFTIPMSFPSELGENKNENSDV